MAIYYWKSTLQIKLKERIEEYDTTRGHNPEFPFDKFKQNKENDQVVLIYKEYLQDSCVYLLPI